MNNSVDYKELLGHFEGQKAKRQAEFKREMEGIDETISGLRKMLASHQSAPSRVNPVGKYAGLSVRWAILNLLAEDSDGPLATGRMAEMLKTGGITSSGQNFASNVSAVISDMTNKKRELESTDSGYQLTETGRRAWEAIRHSPQYLNRASANVSAPPV